MELEISQRKSLPGSLSIDAPLVYYGRVEPIRTSILAKNLPQKELDHAKRYINPEDADSFFASRFALRSVLSSLLSTDPREINLSYTKGGKPYLLDSHVNFNITHSERVFAVAIALGVQIGIDIERMDRELDVVKMLPLLFSPAEQTLIENCEPFHRKRLFIDYWTKKEALLKAIGTGLSQPMNELNVATKNSFTTASSVIVNMKDTHWKLESQSVFENYRLSVAFEHNKVLSEKVVNLEYLNFWECTL